jgi:DNA-binding NtrC family response regulator
VDIVDVRIIAATNKNLVRMVDEGEFREDLFYRLSVVTLRMPPIHERARDIPDLIQFFLKQAAERNGQKQTKFSNEAMAVLRKYSWPGNVRELKNVCEHAQALMPGETVSADRLPVELRVKLNNNVSNTGFKLPAGGIKLDALEVDLIHQALEQAEGNKSKAARLLGLSRDAFLYRMKKHDIDG